MASIPLPFTKVQDGVTITQAQAETYLGIAAPLTGDAQTTLLALIDEARQEADIFLINPFLSLDDNETAQPIPNSVRVGCLRYIGAEWPIQKPGGGAGGVLAIAQQGPIQSEKVGDLSRTYAVTAGRSTGIANAEGLSLGLVAARPHWIKYRLQPGGKRRRGL